MELEQDYDFEEDDSDEDLEELMEDGEGRTIGALGFALGLGLGALLGAGAALLFAPARGEVTRSRISRTLRDFQEDAADQVEDLKSDARRKVKRQRRQLKKRLAGRG